MFRRRVVELKSYVVRSPHIITRDCRFSKRCLPAPQLDMPGPFDDRNYYALPDEASHGSHRNAICEQEREGDVVGRDGEQQGMRDPLKLYFLRFWC